MPLVRINNMGSEIYVLRTYLISSTTYKKCTTRTAQPLMLVQGPVWLQDFRFLPFIFIVWLVCQRIILCHNKTQIEEEIFMTTKLYANVLQNTNYDRE